MNMKILKIVKRISDKIETCKKTNDIETMNLLKDVLFIINKQNKYIDDLKKDLFYYETSGFKR